MHWTNWTVKCPVCVCVWETDRERERERQSPCEHNLAQVRMLVIDRAPSCACVCVCVCVWVRVWVGACVSQSSERPPTVQGLVYQSSGFPVSDNPDTFIIVLFNVPSSSQVAQSLPPPPPPHPANDISSSPRLLHYVLSPDTFTLNHLADAKAT